MVNPIKTLFVLLILSASFSAFSQTRNKKPAAKKTVPAATVKIEPETPEKPSPKKNERPSNTTLESTGSDSSGNGKASDAADPSYVYEFDQPDFVIGHIVIEHDTTGKGKISFTKNGSGDLISDPLQLSPATLDNLNQAFTSLNFLESSEDYQYEKDYSHLGNVKITLRRDGRTRTAKFNWTQNKFARILMDEYRRIANQSIWMFDISVARENQPLESPKLLTSLESLIKRNEIADPNQMVSLLRGLNDDERIPLIARNHAGKLIKQIEKSQTRER